ncbi:flippase [Kibdelosporangium persicum]|uniref:Membrane protein involved in the export of O-antigen and teichoic acid n=1 Tax=Kibdelosporangium persicum TaxID=2698649 RepID=A0ABX2FCS6_9PSEU|nr:flippase [Kibdelosporangium persicum]NRN68686.1 Membrane protein involved in the export of O-antigen and teichoic acid [Kibdelosporangium persicum]
MSRAAAIARGVALQVVARVTALPLAIVTLGVATQYLGEHGYGVMTTAIVFVGLFETLTSQGIGTVIVRRVSGRERASLSHLIGLDLTFSMVYAMPLALTAASIGVLTYPDPEVQGAVLVLSAGLVCSAISSCFDAVFDVHVRYGTVATAEFFSRVATLGCAGAVALTDSGLLAMCAVQILPQVIKMVVTGFAAHRLTPLRPVGDVSAIMGLVRESIPFTLIMLIAVIYWRVDGVLLSLLSDTRQVAAYGIAVQLAFTLNMLPQVFSRTALSTINEGYATDPERFRRAVASGYRFLLLFATPVAVLGIPLAERLVTAVGSDEFAGGATPVLRLFFIACAISFLTSIISDAMVAAHQQKFLTRLSAANLIVNIALNIVLIPHFGAVGCGIALIVTELSGVVFTQVRLRRVGVDPLPVKYLVRLIPGLNLSLLAMLLTWSLPLVVPIVAGMIGYFAGAWLGGAIPDEMRSALLGAMKPGKSTAPA